MSSSSTIIAEPKQLIPCPMTDLEATVDRVQFTNSSRKRRASRETLSLGTDYQLCPVQPSRECQREILFHQSEETANDSEQRIPPIVLPVAMTKPSSLSAASSQQIVPILRRSGNLDLLQCRSEQNCLNLKQKHVSQTWQQNYHHPCLAMRRKFNKKAHMEPSWDNTNVFLGTRKRLANLPGTTTCPWKLNKRMCGTTYRFQEEDAADGPSSAPGSLIQVEVPVHSLLLK